MFFPAILFSVLLIGGCFGQQMMQPKTIPVRRDVGFFCEKDKRCICFGNLYVSRHCEGKVHIYQEEQSLHTNYLVICEGKTDVDPYQYLSMANPGKHSDHGAMLNVRGCPPPSQSYSELIKGGEKNKIRYGEHVPLLTLSIDCTDSKIFKLMSRQLHGLTHLRSLEIVCPALSTLSPDLLSGINAEAYFISISNTSIKTIPPGFFSNLPHLEDISLPMNRLREVHASVLQGLQELKRLTLGKNEIKYLEDGIFLSTRRLTTLDIGNNLISKLPSSLCTLPKLYSLSAENNRLDFILQECLPGLVSLNFLEISGNRLLRLEYDLTSFNSLSSHHPQNAYDFTSDPNGAEKISNLTMAVNETNQEAKTDSHKMLPNSSSPSKLTKTTGNSFFGSGSISKVHLRNNQLKSLPDDAFYGLHELEEVDVSHNQIISLHPNMFSQNKKLRDIQASGNFIADLPEILLKNNAKLRILDFSRNHIRTLGSDFFFNITGLFSILLHNNRIEFLPPNIFKPFDVELGPGGVTMNGLVLSLSGNLLEIIPVLTLPRLTHLHLSRNRLTHIDADTLKYVPYLEYLDLSQNLIKSLGEPPQSPSGHRNESHLFFSGNLKKLKRVNLSRNQLSAFPSLKLILTNLEFLNLSGNQIPGFASDCTGKGRDKDIESAVETLDLSNNSFTWTPYHVKCAWERAVVRNVRQLDLSRNRINFTYCEEKMERKRKVYGCLSYFRELEALEVIILSQNYIDFIPMEFQHYLPKLRLVDLSHNRIKKLWHHDFIITNGVTEDDLDYFTLDLHHYVKRTSVSGDTYYEFPNSHQLTIDLRHNDIASVVLPDDKTRMVPQDCEVETQFARATILLGGNPFHCGCEVFKLLRYSIQEIRPIAEREENEGHRLALPAAIDIQGLKCSKPYNVKGKAVMEPETWAHHLLPLLGLCSYQKGMRQP